MTLNTVAGGRGRLTDRLPVGGASSEESLLAFGPMPERGHILRALLVLSPHGGAHRVESDVDLVVERVEPFRGGVLPPRPAVLPTRFAAARRLVPAGPARALRVDVTEAARDAAGRDDQQLYLLLRGSSDVPSGLLYASPDHLETQLRPRLELMLH